MPNLPHKAPQDKKPGGRPLKLINAAKVKLKLEEYFANCEAKGKPFTVSGMALYLGISRPTLDTYIDRNDAISEVLRWGKLRVENFNEEFLYSGKNPIGTIFNLKNNFSWTDRKEVEQKGSIEISLIDYSDREDAG